MNSSIRVAMIIQGYHPRVGGAERQLASLAPMLQTRGSEVYILTRRYPGLAPFEMIHGIPVYRLPVPGPKPMASLSFTLAALMLLRRLRPHIIHAHELFSPTTTAIMAKRLFGVPVVVKILRGGILGDVTRLKRKVMGQRRLEKFRDEVDLFVTISREIEQELVEIDVPSDRRAFIPNGVDVERFAPAPPAVKRSLRTSLNLPDAPVVIFTGRLAAEKRVAQLIDIWPAVRALHPEARLLLLGTGPEEKKLKESAGAGIQFTGRVDDVVPYLQAADLFVLPSATEGLSNALLEAMATGLPAVATNVGGAPDVIDHKQNGWLIPSDDSSALSEAVITLVADSEFRAKLGQQSREKMVQDYALPIIAERLQTVYNHLSTNHQSFNQRSSKI